MRALAPEVKGLAVFDEGRIEAALRARGFRAQHYALRNERLCLWQYSKRRFCPTMTSGGCPTFRSLKRGCWPF